MAGREPRLQMCSRKAWLLKPRSATTHFGTPGKRSRSGTAWGSSWAWPGARMKATARPSPSAITHALVPYPPRERPSASRSSRPLLVAPFFPRPPPCGEPEGWCRPETSSRVEPHALGPTLLGQEQQPLPHAQVGPADEGLSRSRPGTKLSRDGAPLGPVLMPPDNGRNRAPQILGRGLALGPTRLKQRLQAHPRSVRQHRSSSHQEEQNAIPVREVQGRTGPSSPTASRSRFL